MLLLWTFTEILQSGKHLMSAFNFIFYFKGLHIREKPHVSVAINSARGIIILRNRMIPIRCTNTLCEDVHAETIQWHEPCLFPE